LLSIIHVDMNAFYASCHQAVNPSLKGKPIIVAGNPKKRTGIVLTASYEARKFGVKTAMPNWQTRELCPQGVFITPDYRLYVSFSGKILDILKDYTPVVEQYSIDEAWLDVSGCHRLFGSSLDIAQTIQQRIARELDLPCSIGISCNKLLAKMASDMKKPRGITVLKPEDIPKKIWPMPVGKLIGVGSKLAKHLEEMNIKTIGDLARVPVEILESNFGVVGRHLHDLARGKDDSPVNPHSSDEAKSIGHSATLPEDISSLEEAKQVLLGLAELVGRRARKGNYTGKRITVTIRKNNFKTITRSATIPEPTNLTEKIYSMALKVFSKNWDGSSKIRLLGISLSNLQKDVYQMSFLEENEKLKKINYLIDDIKNRFGENSIFRARLLGGNFGIENLKPRRDGSPIFKGKGPKG